MEDEHALTVTPDHMRHVFGMLTGYVLLPDSTQGFSEEFVELDLAGRVSTIVAGRRLWHVIATDAARSGAYDGSVDGAVRASRHMADVEFQLLPGALALAHELDALLAGTVATIPEAVVLQIAREPRRALDALAYFLRAASIVLHADAIDRGVSVDALLAGIGRALAEA